MRFLLFLKFGFLIVFSCAKAIDIKKTALGDKHQEYALAMNNLAALYKKNKKLGEAEALFLQVNQI